MTNVAVVSSIDDIPNFEDTTDGTEKISTTDFLKKIDEMEQLKGQNKTRVNKNRRTFIVSATLGKSFFTSRVMNKRSKKRMKKLLKNNPEVQPNMKLNEIMHKINFKNKTKIIDMTKETILPDTLKLYKLECLKEEKMIYLYYFIKKHPDDSIIVFTNSINSTKRVNSLMTLLNIKCVCLHSQMQMRQRIKKLDQFRDGKFSVLVSTDVASRGLDIPEVSLVLHLHSPKDIDTMVHRCGRTARLGREGVSVIISDAFDRGRLIKYLKDLGGNERVKNIVVEKTQLDELRTIVADASKIEKEEFKVGVAKKEKSWAKKMADLCGIEIDDERVLDDGRNKRNQEQQSKLKGRKRKLKQVRNFINFY